MPLTFVLNDETVINSYGFRVKNAGIDLTRFEVNPVILAQHYSSLWATIGRWENIRILGSQLLADAVFDMQDEEAAKIAGKVERGYLKGASMGFSPAEEDDNNWNFVKGPDGVPDLMSCELMEASIVTIPSNKKAVKLYANDGTLIGTDLIKLSLSGITEQILNPNMNKLQLSVQALFLLGLNSVEDMTDVSKKIEALAANHKLATEKLEASEAKVKELQTELDGLKDGAAIELIDKAINEKKLGADQREGLLKLAKTDFDAAKKMVDQLSARNTLSDQVDNPDLDASKVKTDEDFQKLSPAEQLAFKTSHPAEYAKLFA